MITIDDIGLRISKLRLQKNVSAKNMSLLLGLNEGYLAPIGVDLICIPAFANIQIDGEERTAIKLICEQR